MIELGSLLVACVCGVVWLVRLEGRIDGHDVLFEEREKQINDRQNDILARLERIERKIDLSNGHARK